MYRTHNCGELTLKNISNEVILSGWVQKIRNKGFIIWIDLRDRYGVTQIIFDQKRSSKKLIDTSKLSVSILPFSPIISFLISTCSKVFGSIKK